MRPYHQEERVTLYCADSMDVYPLLDDNTFDLLFLDPPYFKVKSEWWDKQWDKPAEFLAWMGEHADQWRRLLKPNGSLYVCASPKMAWAVEGVIRERLNVVNVIRWEKDAGWHKKAKYDDLRGYWPSSESIIFAEHHGVESYAKGEAGYDTKCDELRGFVFEPLRAYLDGERRRAGFSDQEMRQHLGISLKGGGLLSHYWGRSQWMLPTEEHYHKLKQLFNSNNGTEPEYLRREYEYLRREYEDLRRPFYATPERPYTDVWHYATVSYFDGKHPAEKPIEMLYDVIQTSSREDAVIGDFFMGRGTTIKAAHDLGRTVIGVDVMEKWCQATAARLRDPVQLRLLTTNGSG